MKLRDLLLDKGPKSIVAKSKIKSKLNNPKKEPGPTSFRAPRTAGLSGDLLNPISGH